MKEFLLKEHHIKYLQSLPQTEDLEQYVTLYFEDNTRRTAVVEGHTWAMLFAEVPDNAVVKSIKFVGPKPEEKKKKKKKDFKDSKFPIYAKYLRIKYSNPISVILAIITPFLQAALGTVLTVFIANNSPLQLGMASSFYWLTVGLNAKRVALGKWKALITFIIFATLGTVVGYYIGIYFS